MNDSALHPDAPYLSSELLDETEVLESENMDEAHEIERELSGLLATKGWQRIAAKMQTDIDSLKSGDAVVIEANTSMEEVGMRYMVAKTTAVNLEVYLNMVNGAAEATREYERRRNSESTRR